MNENILRNHKRSTSVNKINLDADKVQLAMIRKGYTSSSLSKHSGISYETLRRIFRDDKIRISTAYKLTKALDVDIEEII